MYNRDQFIEKDLALIKKIAYRLYYANSYNIPLEDLEWAGHMGLFKAMEKYDGRIEFDKYAGRLIEYKIRDYINNTHPAVFTPRSIQDHRKRLSKTKNRLRKKLHRDPKEDEIAEDMGISIDKLYKIIIITGSFKYRVRPFGYNMDNNKEDNDPIEKLEDPDARKFEEQIEDVDIPDFSGMLSETENLKDLSKEQIEEKEIYENSKWLSGQILKLIPKYIGKINDDYLYYIQNLHRDNKKEKEQLTEEMRNRVRLKKKSIKQCLKKKKEESIDETVKKQKTRSKIIINKILFRVALRSTRLESNEIKFIAHYSGEHSKTMKSLNISRTYYYRMERQIGVKGIIQLRRECRKGELK